MSVTVEMRDPIPRGTNVGLLAVAITRMGPASRSRAGDIHDIGKIYVPANLEQAREGLDIEYTIIRPTPRSVTILKNIHSRGRSPDRHPASRTGGRLRLPGSAWGDASCSKPHRVVEAVVPPSLPAGPRHRTGARGDRVGKDGPTMPGWSSLPPLVQENHS
jgi:hypothetical protein